MTMIKFAFLLKGKYSLVFVQLCLSLIGLVGGRSFNRTAYKILANPTWHDFKLYELTGRSQTHNAYVNLQNHYSTLQRKYYSVAEMLAETIKNENGYHNLEAECFYCQNVGEDKISCFVNCITKVLGTYESYSAAITDAISNLFCKPIGFKFLEEYYSNLNETEMWTRFQVFVDNFQSEGTFSTELMVEFWLSNLLLLQGSPLNFHAFIRGSMANTILEAGTYDMTDIRLDLATPNQFAEMCDNTFATDIAPDIYNLIAGAKQHTGMIDVVLRGHFVMKSAAFYAPGPLYQTLAGSILEMLKMIIGRKCKVLTFADGNDDDDCDQFGKQPISGFPYPEELGEMSGDCRK